jgi:hypothetical protein
MALHRGGFLRVWVAVLAIYAFKIFWIRFDTHVFPIQRYFRAENDF